MAGSCLWSWSANTAARRKFTPSMTSSRGKGALFAVYCFRAPFCRWLLMVLLRCRKSNTFCLFIPIPIPTQRYLLRVRALNSAGWSEWSQPCAEPLQLSTSTSASMDSRGVRKSILSVKGITRNSVNGAVLTFQVFLLHSKHTK